MTDTLQKRFTNAVQATITQAINNGNLTIEVTEQFATSTSEGVDLAATQELNLTEIDW